MDHVISSSIGNPCPPGGPPPLMSNLADVCAQVSADLSLKPICRSSMLSALRTLSRGLGIDLHMVPAQPQALRTEVVPSVRTALRPG